MEAMHILLNTHHQVCECLQHACAKAWLGSCRE